MSDYQGRREFRGGRWMVIAMVFCTALFAVAMVFIQRQRGWGLVSIGMSVATVISLAGIVESLVKKIELTDDAIVVTDLRGRKSYAATAIDSIHEARGVESVLRLKDGRVVKLPSVGSELGNSVRAWLKRAQGAPS
jgi:hypothetical protein